MSFFFISKLCMSRKNAFIANQKVFYYQKALRTSLKAAFLRTKASFVRAFLRCLQKFPFSQTKSFSFAESFANCPQKPPVYVQKIFYLHKPFLVFIQSTPFPPSAFHSHPAITYCPPKNTAVLLISALTPYAVTPEHRTDSKPFRRRLVRKAGFGSCRRKTLLKSFSIEL